MFVKVDSVPLFYGELLDNSERAYFVSDKSLRGGKFVGDLAKKKFPDKRIIIARDEAIRGYYVFTGGRDAQGAGTQVKGRSPKEGS